ncbi:bifunctional glycosyltransferase 87/phosphatase PAP2 family protein [Streptomyces sp. NPDC049954]|uniref:bifunctional glycosyltransferase 87/phosphatase PAP2 family protein n=1 Tax=Streptomyces sp. NPDC049954 TaxID=3155779 RepID=UPI00342DA283
MDDGRGGRPQDVANAEHGGAGGPFGPGRAAETGKRLRVLGILSWAVVAALLVRQVAAVLRLPPGDRLTDLETWIGPEGVLHVSGSLYDTGKFTGTPFYGLVLKPLRESAQDALGVAWTFGSLLLVVALGLLVARAVPQSAAPRRSSLLVAPAAICLFMVSLPVRNALHLGQLSVLPVLLVVIGCFATRGERAAGLFVGLGAAFQPTMLLFAPLLWLTGRRRAAVSSVVTFAASTAVAWIVMPHDSWTYWVHHLAGVGLGSGDSLANQSLHGALLRFGLHGPLEIALFLVLAAAVVVLGLRRAVRYALDGQVLLAVGVTGCVAVAVSPTSWQHQMLWVLLTVIGRVGKRAADRYVWPVAVVLAMSLSPKVLLPNMTSLDPVTQNVILVAALAAACVVPFLSVSAPAYAHPEPTAYAPRRPSRFSKVPLVPAWRWVLRRPNLLLELLLIRVAYSAYSEVRKAARGGRPTAEHHGEIVHSIEKFLHIDIEHWANHAVVKVSWLENFFNFYYESFHFVVPLTVLGVLYVRRPAEYRWARSALGFATMLALLGFWLFPLAPPRLMPDLGFIDTVHGVQDFSQPDYGALTAVTNQYAAMPSLHFGWSLWCGLVIAILAPKWWMKALGLLHPLFTVSAIVATGNHWVLDAVGGAAAVGLGFALVHLLAGPRARTIRAGTGAGLAVGGAGGSAAAPEGPGDPVRPAPGARPDLVKDTGATASVASGTERGPGSAG